MKTLFNPTVFQRLEQAQKAKGNMSTKKSNTSGTGSKKVGKKAKSITAIHDSLEAPVPLSDDFLNTVFFKEPAPVKYDGKHTSASIPPDMSAVDFLDYRFYQRKMTDELEEMRDTLKNDVADTTLVDVIRKESARLLGVVERLLSEREDEEPREPDICDMIEADDAS